jgi:hypothetical protein
MKNKGKHPRSEARGVSQNNENPRHVPTIEAEKHKHEVIDLTLEEVSCSIVFRPVF